MSDPYIKQAEPIAHELGFVIEDVGIFDGKHFGYNIKDQCRYSPNLSFRCDTPQEVLSTLQGIAIGIQHATREINLYVGSVGRNGRDRCNEAITAIHYGRDRKWVK